jgi:hypothetical protein
MQRRDPLQARYHRPAGTRTLLLLGFWMRSAFVGAARAAAGVGSMVGPQGVSSETALILMVFGAAFARHAWQRTAELLVRIDTNTPLQTHASMQGTTNTRLRVHAHFAATGPEVPT